MSIETLPIYNKLFAFNAPIDKNQWESFKTKPDSIDVINPSEVDFAVTPKIRAWKDTAYEIALIVMKVILFPWIIYEGIKYTVGRVFMRIVLPAQFQTKNKIDNYRKILMNSDEAQGIITRYVTLQKNGINYRGILVGRESNILNGNWALHAVGNNIPVEYALPNQAIPYLGSSAGSGFNVLLINEPNVGGSEGVANPENMANSQEIGISFLESAVRAKKIVLTGHSIGGASIGQAILQHDFKPSIDYLVIRLMTFDTLRHMAQLSAGNFGERIVDWLDYDMDSVAASRKLQDQKIPEIIIQGEKDGIMEHATLLDALQKEGITQNKSFHTIPNATHNYFPHDELNGILFKKEKPNIETNLSTWLSKIPGFGFLKALLKKSAS